MPKRILVVEDEEDLVVNLEYNLQREGYATERALTGERGLELALQQSPPDIILLDRMLPDLSGLEVCRRLRQDPRTQETPILMLTAKGEERDRISGLETGADDYVVKPFSVRELMLRVKSLLRRKAENHPSAPTELSAGLLKVDLVAHQVWVDDQEVTLTALEFRLLSTFLERRGRVQTRDGLLRDVWGIQANITTRTVDTHVKRLRQKLSVAGDYIETLRGVGYRFREELPEAAP